MHAKSVLFRGLATAALLSAGLPVFATDACTARQLNLADATWYMLEHNPQVDQARSLLAGAQADQITAGERPNPTLSFNSTNYNTRSGLGSGNPWQKNLDSVLRIDQPIERGGKRDLRLKASAAGKQASEMDYRDLLRQLRLNTANAYYGLLLAQQHVAVDLQLVELQHQTEAAAALRLAAGDIAESDLVRIRVDSSRADSELQSAEADLDSARITLASLLGCDAEPGNDALFADAEWPNPAAEPTIPEHSNLVSRPDVEAARAREQQAQVMSKLAEAQRTRDISVGVQYEHFPPDGQQLLGAGFSVPLFLFNNSEGEIARAHADADAANAAAQQAQLLAQADVAQARSALRHAAQRALRAERDLLPLSEKSAAAIDFSYRHGAAGVLDLLDAYRTLHAARLEVIDAKADYAKAMVAWQIAENLPETLEPLEPLAR
jgi:cobalt-zinc-cadmium efflux system outer membrane protein